MKFEVKKSSNGQFRFNLIASNGQIVATSESYRGEAIRIGHHRIDQKER